jgi:hypothetical protein
MLLSVMSYLQLHRGPSIIMATLLLPLAEFFKVFLLLDCIGNTGAPTAVYILRL